MDQVDVVRGSFLAINREERFFCSLLTHALLSSLYLREQFYSRVKESCQITLDWQPGATEVYSEVAWLRDHWRNLGDPRHWTPDLEHERIQMVSTCLGVVGKDLGDVENRSFFRTRGKVPKVVTPGRWPLSALDDDWALKLLKWAFNAKPDFLLVCNDRAVIIEAKVESQPGKSPNGFSQDAVQEALCLLIPAVAPYLDSQAVGRLWLAPKKIASRAATIRWSEVADVAAATPSQELDDFSRTGLERFARRAQTSDLVTE